MKDTELLPSHFVGGQARIQQAANKIFWQRIGLDGKASALNSFSLFLASLSLAELDNCTWFYNDIIIFVFLLFLQQVVVLCCLMLYR